ncbi:zf-HC2 domain-containing protein [Desulfosporosinus fructosivorans]|uniref:Zf-HC2 domain-containing protein n=1 Tax=Desulfosporosinus fructosivorans TaxID=2018669 RepID=A0A4Z0R5Z1_9FIRM|nr:zf-HC2 domain-containing protein [Desulfosporosinus fructosivorans]TGE38531.1 zf-HC2 domain-containing protein [Desulfosporosinus fructosivorans]
MTCYRSRNNWHSYVKASLNEAELEDMTAHLTHCSECLDIVSIIQETAGIFAKSQVILSPPSTIKLNVMMAIDKNRYKKVSFPHLLELKNWGFSMVAAGVLLLALNLTSLAPTIESGQVAQLNSQIVQQISLQISHPFERISQAAYSAIGRLETITSSPPKNKQE